MKPTQHQSAPREALVIGPLTDKVSALVRSMPNTDSVELWNRFADLDYEIGYLLRLGQWPEGSFKHKQLTELREWLTEEFAAIEKPAKASAPSSPLRKRARQRLAATPQSSTPALATVLITLVCGMVGAAVVLTLARPANAAEVVTIRSCYDGDTCRTTSGERIRLACIDTPELRGNRANPIPAKAARDYLRSFLAGKTISLRRITTDRYGRTVGELYANGANVQQQLVASGHAAVMDRYAHQCSWAR